MVTHILAGYRKYTVCMYQGVLTKARTQSCIYKQLGNYIIIYLYLKYTVCMFQGVLTKARIQSCIYKQLGNYIIIIYLYLKYTVCMYQGVLTKARIQSCIYRQPSNSNSSHSPPFEGEGRYFSDIQQTVSFSPVVWSS